MQQHLMIDCETLDTALSCVILSIGMVQFCPYTGEVFMKYQIKPSVDEQIAAGRTISESTIQWWESQSKEAFDTAFSVDDRISLKESLDYIRAMYSGCKRVWSHGAGFDIPAVGSLFSQFGEPPPWAYYDCRDTRTVYEMANVSLRDDGFVTSHDAEDDALRQVNVLHQAYKKLGIVNASER